MCGCCRVEAHVAGTGRDVVVVELKHTWLGLGEMCSCCRVEVRVAWTGRDVLLL